MARKRKSKKKGSFETPLKMAVAGGAALIATDMATKQITFMQDNAMLAGGIKVGAGVFLAMQKEELVKGAGLGIATSGVKDLLDQFMSGDGVGNMFSKGGSSPGGGNRQIAGLDRNKISVAEYARMNANYARANQNVSLRY